MNLSAIQGLACAQGASKGLGTSPTTALPANYKQSAWCLGWLPPTPSVGAAIQDDALGPGLGEDGGGGVGPLTREAGDTLAGESSCGKEGGGKDTELPPSLSPVGTELSHSRVLS